MDRLTDYPTDGLQLRSIRRICGRSIRKSDLWNIWDDEYQNTATIKRHSRGGDNWKLQGGGQIPAEWLQYAQMLHSHGCGITSLLESWYDRWKSPISAILPFWLLNPCIRLSDSQKKSLPCEFYGIQIICILPMSLSYLCPVATGSLQKSTRRPQRCTQLSELTALMSIEQT